MNGTLVGKYEIKRVIGRGSVGVVYEAWDPILVRKVAIKVLPQFGDDEEGQEKRPRFLREAQAAGSLYHNNIVVVYDYGETESSAYIVMELVSGQSLGALLEHGTLPPMPEVAAIMDGLLAGLQHSHERKVVHRDIKPMNVLVAADGTVKITDFGIAHLESSEMTRLGTVMGTPAYMSPEQVLGEAVDARTDLYSAGVVLYQMLLGRRPFEGSTASIMHRIVNTQPVLPPDIPGVVSPGMAAILLRALAKQSEDRYGSAREFAHALHGEFRQAGIPSPGSSSRHPADATIIQGPRTGVPPEPGAGPPAGTPDLTSNTAMAKRSSGPVLRAGTHPLLRPALGSLAGMLLLGGVAWWVAGRYSPDPAVVTASPALSNDTGQRPPPEAAALALQAAVNEAAASLPCSLLLATVSSRDVALNGLTALGETSEMQIRTVLQRVVAQASPSMPVAWNTRRIDGPYCGVLDLLRSARSGGADPARASMLRLAARAARAAVGNTVRLSIAMPDAAATVLLDYYDHDRLVTHLLPARADGAAEAAVPDAGFALRYSRNAALVVLIVASEPILAQVRPAQEAASAYLDVLKPGLDRARGRSSRLAIETLVIDGTGP